MKYERMVAAMSGKPEEKGFRKSLSLPATLFTNLA